MPMLVLPDGSVLTWDATPTPAPLTSAAPITSAVDATQTDTQSDTRSPTQADVTEALAKVPPRWVATLSRFAKGFLATLLATLAVYGGNIEAIIRDPKAFIVAFGSAAILAIQKWASWAP